MDKRNDEKQMTNIIIKHKNKTVFLTQPLLKELLIYDSLSGNVFWRDRGEKWFVDERSYNIFKTSFLMKQVKNVDGAGYYQIPIFGKFFLSHRVIWLYVHGYWPENQIDHINGNKLDNRIENLRECTIAQNMHNSKPNKNARIPYKGVYLRKDGMYISEIHNNNKKFWLGSFKTAEDAAKAYDEAAIKMHGEFAKINITG